MKSVQSRWRRLARGLADLGRAVVAWRWGSPVVRAAAAALGLVVLAAIGRSALARGASRGHEPAPEPGPSDSTMQPEALAAPLAIAAAPLPVVAAPAADTSGGDAGEGTSRGRATPDDPVYLNTATLADLRRLPGVGLKRAQAILTLRDRIQRFRLIEDLLKVKGIGRASLRKLRPLVRLDMPPTPPPSPEEAGANPPPLSPG